ncbi:hypothetical protein QP185_20080 [Sphingomonas aerolata]|uniref:hypothetical protein n=1 Tax=Sphingomonas aerolata TaxID=185951 RepID=UPI002FE1BED5
MEAIGTTGGTDNPGGVNRGRGFDFNIFSSDLFNSIAVRKTATADVEEGSLGGTGRPAVVAPVRPTRRPPRSSRRALSYNDLREKVTPKISGLITKTSDDGRFDVLLSVAAWKSVRSRRKARTSRAGTYGGFNAGFNAASRLPGKTLAQINDPNPATGLYHPRIPGLVSYDIFQKRLGAAGSVSSSLLQGADLARRALFAARRHAPGIAAAGDQLQPVGHWQATDGHPRRRGGRRQQHHQRHVRQRRSAHPVALTASWSPIFTRVTGTLDQKFGENFKIGAVVGYAGFGVQQPDPVDHDDRCWPTRPISSTISARGFRRSGPAWT